MITVFKGKKLPCYHRVFGVSTECGYRDWDAEKKKKELRENDRNTQSVLKLENLPVGLWIQILQHNQEKITIIWSGLQLEGSTPCYYLSFTKRKPITMTRSWILYHFNLHLSEYDQVGHMRFVFFPLQTEHGRRNIDNFRAFFHFCHVENPIEKAFSFPITIPSPAPELCKISVWRTNGVTSTNNLIISHFGTICNLWC